MIGMFMRLWGWAALVPLAIGVAAAIGWWSLRAEAALLDAEGVETTATVSRVFERSRRSGNSRSTSYYARYSFSTGSALEGTLDVHLGEVEVSRDFYDRVNAGDRVPLRYLPSDPEIFEIEEGAVAWESGIAGIIALCMGGAGLVLVIWIGRKAARMVAARDRGETVRGRVTQLIKAGSLVVMEFAFPGPDGAEVKRRSRPRAPKVFAGFAPGMEVSVRRHPQDARLGWWAPDLGLAP